ncbi:MAG TPA: hypothetical protein VFK49_05960 [Stellaceae bacterium]|nr:hypothetical protein [Stellaceae bacterium]
MRLHPLFWLLLLAPLAAACGATPPLEAVRATPDGVTFAYGDGRADDAARQASLYCANLGRSAHLREVTQDGGADLLAVFDCR